MVRCHESRPGKASCLAGFLERKFGHHSTLCRFSGVNRNGKSLMIATFQIALFSAIVTAFLVPTIGNLTPQPGQDTDALIASLIDVVVQIASLNGLKVPIVTAPEPFRANPKDEAAASFWFTSLIVSVSKLIST